MLANAQNKELITKEAVDELEKLMLPLEQTECPVVHHFGPGIYVREVTLPAGSIAIGHAQKREHLNIFHKGKVAIVNDGNINVIEAPLIFTGKPGRKVGYIIEDVVWWNIYSNPTNERDIDKLEEMFLDKSDSWKENNESSFNKEYDSKEEDRIDFFEVIKSAGFTPEKVREQSENMEDQMPMPEGYGQKITIRKSPIEGLGVFASFPIEDGELIAPARINGYRTPIGRYTNHSKNPNAYFMKSGDDIYLISNKRISGCKGGDSGEEITIDYRQALKLSGIEV